MLQIKSKLAHKTLTSLLCLENCNFNKDKTQSRNEKKRHDDGDVLLMTGLLCGRQDLKNILTYEWVLMRKNING